MNNPNKLPRISAKEKAKNAKKRARVERPPAKKRVGARGKGKTVAPVTESTSKFDARHGSARKLDLLNPPHLLNNTQLGKCLGVSMSILARMRSEGVIPTIDLGGRARYELNAVLRSLRSKRGIDYKGLKLPDLPTCDMNVYEYMSMINEGLQGLQDMGIEGLNVRPIDVEGLDRSQKFPKKD